MLSELAKRIEDTKVKQGSIAIFWLIQGGFVFKTAKGKVIYVDPYLSDSANRVCDLKRMVPVPMAPEEARADLVVITHDHLDHLDPDTLIPMAESCNAKFVGPISCVRHLREIKIPRDRIVELNEGEAKEVEEGITITAVHAEHPPIAVGYVFDMEGIKLYISGDTRNHEKLKEAANFHPDVVLICANGKPDNEYINLNADEAALLTKTIKPQVVIPMHYGLFVETHEDPQTFVDALKRHNVSVQCVVMEFKGCYVYCKEIARSVK
jgi:L-ascorbate 6-phosphate lactonase